MQQPAIPARHPLAVDVDFLAQIGSQSRALADAAEANLDADVEHCPGWTVRDLLEHLREVQWFWALIVERRLQDAPSGQGEFAEVHPSRLPDDGLISAFRAGARHLVEVLADADPAQSVWTWAPARQDIGFILRHQVQEAAVHRWDAEHAASREVSLDARMSVDAIEEFLTYSVANSVETPDQPRPALGGAFVLRASDLPACWVVEDGSKPGTVAFRRDGDPSDLPVISGTASDLLLWLYGRRELYVEAAAADLIARFTALRFTD
ncbi:MAG: hypothetical protein JWN95_3409 [Frankiales bacterium]|nr:hypothetical protein [Frankiales bacterium]